MIFLVLNVSIQLISPWVLMYAIDDLTLDVTRQKLAVYSTLLIVIALTGGVFSFLTRRTIIGISRQVEYDLKNDFFSHLQRLSMDYFQRHRTGDLMSRVTNDLNAVRMMVGPAVMYSCTTSMTFVVAVLLMFSISPRLTLLGLLPLPFVSLVVKGFGKAIYQRSEQVQEALAHMSATVQEALAGVRVVRAYGREAGEIERFRESNDDYLNRNRTVIQLQALFYPTMALFLGFSGLIVLWQGSRLVVENQITVGDFVAFNAYLVMLAWPMIAFGWVTNMLQRGLAAWHRILTVLEAVPSITDRGLGGACNSEKEIQGKVEFRNLHFAYDDQPILEAVSATVEAGQMLALVGATGSGKSTLVNLLPRLFDPPPQSVLIDGIDIRDLPLSALRRAIGYVPQEPFLFSQTIAQNVAFGLSSFEHQIQAVSEINPIERAVDIACLDKDLIDFREGLDTTVGERGVTLSGGQKQRVAIARALMADPKILILDDAFSSVDTKTEQEILTGLRPLLRQRTSIVVSHRISTIREADLILVLDGGQVIERGDHRTLVAKAGVYAELHRKQLLEAELDAS